MIRFQLKHPHTAYPCSSLIEALPYLQDYRIMRTLNKWINPYISIRNEKTTSKGDNKMLACVFYHAFYGILVDLGVCMCVRALRGPFWKLFNVFWHFFWWVGMHPSENVRLVFNKDLSSSPSYAIKNRPRNQSLRAQVHRSVQESYGGAVPFRSKSGWWFKMEGFLGNKAGPNSQTLKKTKGRLGLHYILLQTVLVWEGFLYVFDCFCMFTLTRICLSQPGYHMLCWFDPSQPVHQRWRHWQKFTALRNIFKEKGEHQNILWILSLLIGFNLFQIILTFVFLPNTPQKRDFLVFLLSVFLFQIHKSTWEMAKTLCFFRDLWFDRPVIYGDIWCWFW